MKQPRIQQEKWFTPAQEVSNSKSQDFPLGRSEDSHVHETAHTHPLMEVTNQSWPFPAAHARVFNHFRHVLLFATPWTIGRQAPLSMGFSRQEDMSGLPCPPLTDLPDPGIEPKFLALCCSLAGEAWMCVLTFWCFRFLIGEMGWWQYLSQVL